VGLKSEHHRSRIDGKNIARIATNICPNVKNNWTVLTPEALVEKRQLSAHISIMMVQNTQTSQSEVEKQDVPFSKPSARKNESV
jgi:hypothetical protein